MKTQTITTPAKSGASGKLYVRTKTVSEPVSLNDIDVMTPEIDYMSDEKADWLLVLGVVVMGFAAVASWIIGG